MEGWCRLVAWIYSKKDTEQVAASKNAVPRMLCNEGNVGGWVGGVKDRAIIVGEGLERAQFDTGSNNVLCYK